MGWPITTAATAALLATSAGAQESFVLDPIMVTGERIERALAQTATSVTVFTPEDIERSDSTSVLDAIRTAPNITPATSESLPPIRGLQSGGPADLASSIQFGGESRAVLILDDVARSPSYTNNSFQQTFDLEQIEVLRGPQTTLRGANSIAGAFIVKTRDPEFFQESKVQAGLQWDEFSKFTWRGAAMTNIPLIEDQLAARFTYEYQDGAVPVVVFDDPGNDVGSAPPGTDLDALSGFRNANFRGKLLYTPTARPGLSALLTLEAQAGRDIGFDSWIQGRDQNGNRPPEERLYQYGQQRIFNTDAYAVTLNAAQETDSGTFRSITSYQWSEFSNAPDANEALIFDRVDNRNFNQDLLWSFQDWRGRVDGVLGATIGVEEDNMRLSGFDLDTTGNDTTLGAFGDFTIDVAPKLQLLAGGRLQWSGSTFDSNAFAGTNAYKHEESETVFLPKLGLLYNATETDVLSLTARRGYNPGGGGLDFADFTRYTFEPEYVWTFEAGYRGTFQDGRLSLNATAFYNDYKDYQFLYYPTEYDFAIFNYDGQTYGLELQGAAAVTETLTANLGLGLLSTEIDAPGTAIDGNRFGVDPRATVTGGVVWEARPGLSLDGTLSYVSGYYNDFTEAPGTESGDYYDLDLGATYVRGALNVRAFARNATDEFAYFQRFDAGGTGFAMPPRTLGVTASLTF